MPVLVAHDPGAKPAGVAKRFTALMVASARDGTAGDFRDWPAPSRASAWIGVMSTSGC